MNRPLLVGWLFLFSFQHSYSQNVGIGLTNPTRAKLEINGMVGNTVAIFGGDGNGVSIQRNNSAIGFNHYFNAGDKYIANGYAAAQWFNFTNGVMYFDFWNSGTANQNATGLTRALVLKPGGLVGVGNTDPHGELQLSNTGGNRKIVLWETANDNHQYYGFGIETATLRYAVDAVGAHKFYSAINGSSSSLLMTIGSNKKVVIGTQNGTGKLGINSGDPQTTLEVVQTGHTGIALIDPNTFNYWEFRTGFNSPSGQNHLYFYYNAVVKAAIQADGSYFQFSDFRLKKKIQPLAEVLPKVLQLQPKTYLMKDNNSNNEVSIGFVAQDVKKLFPELVSINNNSSDQKDLTDLHMMNYSGFGVIAIKAIQEQQQIIQQQQKQIDELNKRLEIVERKNN